MSRARRKVRTGRLGTDGADGVVAPGNPSVIPGQTKRGQRLVLRQNLARRLVVERSVLIRPLIPRDSLGHSSFRTTSVRTAAWSLAEAQRRPVSRAPDSNFLKDGAVRAKLASVRSMSGVAVGFTLRPVAEYGMPSMWYPTKPTWYSRDSPRFRLETIALMTAVRLAATSSRFVGGAIAHNPSHRPGYRLTNNLMAAGTFGPAFTEGGLPLRSERLPGDLSGRRPTTPMLPVPLHLGTPTGRARQAYP